MAKFKAINVGGSIAGIMLASTFDSAGIDCVPFERLDTVAPALGATSVDLSFVAPIFLMTLADLEGPWAQANGCL